MTCLLLDQQQRNGERDLHQGQKRKKQVLSTDVIQMVELPQAGDMAAPSTRLSFMPPDRVDCWAAAIMSSREPLCVVADRGREREKNLIQFSVMQVPDEKDGMRKIEKL